MLETILHAKKVLITDVLHLVMKHVSCSCSAVDYENDYASVPGGASVTPRGSGELASSSPSANGDNSKGVPVTVLVAIACVVTVLILVCTALCAIHRRRSKRKAKTRAAKAHLQLSEEPRTSAPMPPAGDRPSFPIPMGLAPPDLHWAGLNICASRPPIIAAHEESSQHGKLEHSMSAQDAHRMPSSLAMPDAIIQVPTEEGDSRHTSVQHVDAEKDVIVATAAGASQNAAVEGSDLQPGPSFLPFPPPSFHQRSSPAPPSAVHAEHELMPQFAVASDGNDRSSTSVVGREAVLETVKALSAQHHVLHQRFVLMNRALKVGGQGCVQLAVDKNRDHERVVVKTFFRCDEFASEASFYLQSAVQKEALVPHCFALGSWEQVRTHTPAQHKFLSAASSNHSLY